MVKLFRKLDSKITTVGENLFMTNANELLLLIWRNVIILYKDMTSNRGSIPRNVTELLHYMLQLITNYFDEEIIVYEEITCRIENKTPIM